MAKPRRVSLFVTCLADQMRPETAWAAVELLERAGCTVDVPMAQTCCGQPAFNSGFRNEAREVARHWLKVFRDAEAIVCPSGSCASMVKVFFQELFEPQSPEGREVARLAERTYELTQFLVHVLGVTNVGAHYEGKVAYHASCHLLRELGERTSPKALLEKVVGAELVALPGSETVCCGFGGTFSVKLPEISTAMMDEKIRAIEASGADCVVACDGGCLLQISGGLTRQGARARAFHLAELLTGRVPEPDRR
ncbi:MAG: (Fe-S)-binding protein [Planctomycetes bacterium]|nr:(Fe-S)-binding protein [Planctomycetota bacterium]